MPRERANTELATEMKSDNRSFKDFRNVSSHRFYGYSILMGSVPSRLLDLAKFHMTDEGWPGLVNRRVTGIQERKKKHTSIFQAWT